MNILAAGKLISGITNWEHCTEKEIHNDKFHVSEWFSLAYSNKLSYVGCVVILVADHNWFSQFYKATPLEKEADERVHQAESLGNSMIH